MMKFVTSSENIPGNNVKKPERNDNVCPENVVVVGLLKNFVPNKWKHLLVVLIVDGWCWCCLIIKSILLLIFEDLNIWTVCLGKYIDKYINLH